jgi:formiminotetrahydrofolate cyclodeaminase
MSEVLLADLPVRQFVTELGASSATPGGGAGAALAGSLAAALAQMVGSLTVNRKKYQEVQERMESLVARAGQLAQDLLVEMDADAEAYNQVMQAFKLPKFSDEEKAV